MRDVSVAVRSSLKNLATYGNLCFTSRQLYYEACRAAKQPKGLDLGAAAAVFAVGSILPAIGLTRRKIGLAAGLFAAGAFGSGGLAWLRYTAHTLAPPFSFESFENALAKYLQNQKRPIGLLSDEDLNTHFADSYPRDLALYGLPRLLVCQSAEIARMLLANNFHLEASCAVIDSQTDLPLKTIFQEMIVRAGAEARVCFLHDASFEGISWSANLRERLQLPASARLQVLGLRPAHAGRIHLFAQQGAAVHHKQLDQKKLETLAFLSDDEKRWLAAGKQAEVAAVNPVRLLRVLRRLILNLPIALNSWKLTLPPRDLGFM